jgi:hypothetical protein
MSNQQTPKSRARRVLKTHIETMGHTLEDLFADIAREIEAAEARGAAEQERRAAYEGEGARIEQERREGLAAMGHLAVSAALMFATGFILATLATL